MKLIANMVGKNEADRFLIPVLEHLKNIVDEIVFTDDCSDDPTMAIAKDFGCHTYQTPEPLFSKHEGQLRQTAWSNLVKHAQKGDWILAIDCDEKLYTTDPSLNLEYLCNQKDYDVLNIKFYHMWNETQYRVDKAWVPNNSSRLFKFYPYGTYADRKMACGSEPSYVQMLISNHRYLVNTGLVMQHLGYVKDEDKIMKYERYTKLDGGDFHAMAHIESIADMNPTLIDWNLG